MNYWEECVSEALDDCNIKATMEQIETIASWVEGAHENYGMAHGYDVISRGAESESTKELRQLKTELEKKRIWECETKPCKYCLTTGTVKDGWGRDVKCDNCDGKGRL